MTCKNCGNTTKWIPQLRPGDYWKCPDCEADNTYGPALYDTVAEHVNAQQVANDPIEPNHYISMAISPLEYIKANDMGWNVGNVIKYVSRYKNKNGLEDLKKAKWYLDNLIEDLEK